MEGVIVAPKRMDSTIMVTVVSDASGIAGIVFEKLGHELLEHIALLKAFPVLGENRRIPDRIVRR